MPEFAELQRNAETLCTSLTRALSSQRGCMAFFTPFLTTSSVEDASIISKLARILGDANHDDALVSYLQPLKGNDILRVDEVLDFKYRVICGSYLFKWAQYDAAIISLSEQPLIKLFQSHLDIKSIDSMDSKKFASCMTAFSQYCSFVFMNKDKSVYAELNNYWGADIQVNIHNVRCKSPGSNPIHGVVNSMLGKLGMNN